MTLQIIPTTEVGYTTYKTTKSGGAVGAGLEDLNAVYLDKKERGQDITEEKLDHGITVSIFGDTSNTAFLLRDGDTPIGHLSTWTRTKQTAGVFVKPKYQGLGFGKKLYEVALQHFGTLYSDNALSEFSAIVWQALSKKHTVKLVFKDKEVPIVGWVVGKGRMTYPVLKGKDLGLEADEVSLETLFEQARPPKMPAGVTGEQYDALMADYMNGMKMRSAAEASRFVAHK